MLRKLILLPPLMGLCLFLAPDRSPVALSQSVDSFKPEVSDDGSTLPEEEVMAQLAQSNPTAFLEACLRRYAREVRGYSGVLHKQERIEGKLHPSEVIDFWFQEEPYSVLMKWKEGARLVRATMFIEGENDGKVMVLPKLVKMLIDQDPEGRMARQSARYTMKEFSIRQGTERTLRAWKAAQERNALSVEYRGVQTIAELGGRKCHVLVRTCDQPEDDGVVTRIEIYVDAENWLQIGSILKDADGNLVGKYFFPVVNLNPDYPADTFTKARLKS